MTKSGKQLKITGSKRRLKKYRRELEAFGFTYKESSKYRASMTRTFSGEEEHLLRQYERKYRYRRGIYVEVRDTAYTRSSNYRECYFNAARPAIGSRYRCIYCGKLLRREDVTVDHIFPVSRTATSPVLKTASKAARISNINDVKNLGAACAGCNGQKGSKGGTWIIRGIIGKSELIWRVRLIFRAACMIAMIYVLGTMIITYWS